VDIHRQYADNVIGAEGSRALSEALMTNSSLTQLEMKGKFDSGQNSYDENESEKRLSVRKFCWTGGVPNDQRSSSYQRFIGNTEFEFQTS